MWVEDNSLINRPARWLKAWLSIDLLKMSHYLLHFLLWREDAALTGSKLQPFLPDLRCEAFQNLMHSCHRTVAVPGLHDELI